MVNPINSFNQNFIQHYSSDPENVILSPMIMRDVSNAYSTIENNKTI